MAKSKTTRKATPTKVVCKGLTYLCTRKNGKVTVKLARTANGQNLLVGVLDIATGAWQNESGQSPFPREAKETIIRLFPKN